MICKDKIKNINDISSESLKDEKKFIIVFKYYPGYQINKFIDIVSKFQTIIFISLYLLLFKINR